MTCELCEKGMTKNECANVMWTLRGDVLTIHQDCMCFSFIVNFCPFCGREVSHGE